VYLFSDQHRHDAMGCTGNRVIQTPNLDRLASRGARFSRMYCQSPICQPSRASVITGLYTHQHGISQNVAKDLDPALPTMMKQLQNAGYTTAVVGKTHFYTPRRDRIKETADGLELDLREYGDFVRSFGFDYVLEEFDRYVHAHRGVNFTTPYTEYLSGKGLLKRYQEQISSVWRLTPDHWNGLTSVLPQEDDLTSFIADRSIDWLRDYRDDKPFFLMVSFVQPHVPLMDDPVWADYYRNTDIPPGPRESPASPNEVWGDYLENRLFKHSNSHLLTDEYVLNAARHYYGMVSLIDQRIGDIVRTVEDLGLRDNTWFLYSADHGEMLGDHNLMAKMNFYKSSVLVPAIISPPQPRGTRVVDGLTESIDLSATVLDIAGAQPLEGSDSRSLLPLLDGESSTREVTFSAIKDGGSNSYFVMAATERYRMTLERNSGTPCELFDLKEDPDELSNRVNDPAYEQVRSNIVKTYIEPHLGSESH
jgi:arylsulfatase